MKALFVDAEWKHTQRFSPLMKQLPMYLLPVLNETILEHNIKFLYQKGITEAIVIFSEKSEISELESIKERNNGEMRIHLYKETKPRGTAGILSDVMSLLGTEPFLVINNNVYIKEIDIEGLIDFHNRKGSVVTACVKRGVEKTSNIEAIKISRDGLLEEVHIIHWSMDRRSPWVFSGIYLFTPAVFDFIDAEQYFDIKEQLIPQLQSASLSVYAYEMKDYQRNICNLEDYYKLQRDLLQMDDISIYFGDQKEIAERVWVGKDVSISSGSYLRGPILLGNECCISNGAQIIGPTVIGDGCKIAEDAVVRESILWRNVYLEKRASSEYCIVEEGLIVPEGERLRNMVAVGDLRMNHMNLVPQEFKLTGFGNNDLSQILVASLGNWFFNLTKRAIDLFVACISLLILSPIYVLLALAIKIDSRGPVFYIQKRCGKNGKMFGMFKFRTMVVSAEEMHSELVSQKDTDGPMFKMANDPRVTRLGGILRGRSLDELPQLINVITGEMSLVGPRPLIMEEMKFSPTWRDMRLRVKPGITGLWQVQGRSEAPFHDWIRYDVEYVMKQSLWMDIKILFKTTKVVYTKVGAH